MTSATTRLSSPGLTGRSSWTRPSLEYWVARSSRAMTAVFVSSTGVGPAVGTERTRNDETEIRFEFQTADTRPHSRGGRRPRFAFRVPQTGGSRKCRMRAAPAVSRAKWVKKTHTSIQVQRRHSGIPCAMALRLTSRSPRRIGLCCLRRLRIAGSSAPGRADLPSADLTPTTEASGPHDFTVRFGIVRPARRCPLTENRPANKLHARHRRVHRIPSQRSVTMANAPSSGTGWRES